ncbi:MAG TPA: hypothetical protein VE291_06835 [Terracidiphilus sp.]|jgi:galactose mutarotase-like enzyme|nr:hypothetical protein [Terracidiphilus sp.]
MGELLLTTGCMVNGLDTIRLENRLLCLDILPQAGGKIRQITYKPLDAQLLWNNPHIAPAQHAPMACYDDLWSGGWDEIFPNDEADTLEGLQLPDHGELWTGCWHSEPFEGEQTTSVRLRLTTPISRFKVEKTITLRPENAAFEVRYRFTNAGEKTFPFLWKLHPAFAVSARHRIDFPPMTVRRELEFPGSLGEAPTTFPWPHAPLGEKLLDLRQVPDVSSQALHFFYGTEMAAGWCGITNRANRLATALRFDPRIFPTCWLFASHGGWQDLNVAVLEPATGYPFRIPSMIEAGRARSLAPGERLETTVLFSTQEGLMSIGGVAENGKILPGDEG